MKIQPSTKVRKKQERPQEMKFGRASVTVYRRKIVNGKFGFMVANYADGKRRFDSYPTEEKAIKAANTLVRKVSKLDVVAAAMTNSQASDYASAVEILAPFHVPLTAVASTVAECLRLVGGDLANLHATAKSFASRQKTTRKGNQSAFAVGFAARPPGGPQCRRGLGV